MNRPRRRPIRSKVKNINTMVQVPVLGIPVQVLVIYSSWSLAISR